MIDPEIGVHLSALEYLVMDTRRLVYQREGISLDDARASHAKLLNKLAALPLVKTADPALSDHWSAEVVQHLGRILAGLETVLETQKK